jgi:hypothetical protein
MQRSEFCSCRVHKHVFLLLFLLPLLHGCSVDSAELRAAEAQQRLKDFGESHAELRATTVLPSAADAFDEVRCCSALLAGQGRQGSS